MKNAIFYDVMPCGTDKNGVTSQKMAFFIVTALRTSNLTHEKLFTFP
jgi:hypothetical protein